MKLSKKKLPKALEIGLKKDKSLSNFTGEGEEFIPINSTCCDFIVSSMDRKEKYRTKLADDNAFDNNLAA